MANRRLRKEIVETARGLYELGAVDGKTMREFESLRVQEPPVYTAYEIKRLRLRERPGAEAAEPRRTQGIEGAGVEVD
jgi:DNA-binding transcriptional regulator YiaG